MPTLSVLGLGRVCRDAFFTYEGSARRFDSRKSSVNYLGERLGGSVPAILEVLAANGVHAEQIAGTGEQPWAADFVLQELAARGISAQRVVVQRTPESMVMLDEQLALIDIVVESEREGISLIAPSAVRDLRLPDTLSAFVFDARHPEAACLLARRANDSGIMTFADPGTLGGMPSRRHATMCALKEARIVFAAENTLRMLSDDGDLDAVARDLLGAATQMVISTRGDGGCDVIGRQRSASLHPVAVTPVGSSIGAGDLCRGHFLLELLKGLRGEESVPFGLVTHALSVGLAAAAWRIEDATMFPSVPSEDALEAFLTRVKLANDVSR